MLRGLSTVVTALGCGDNRRKPPISPERPFKDPSFMRLEEDGEGEPLDGQEAAETPPLVLTAFIFPALTGFNFGYDIGSTGGAIQRLASVAPSLGSSPLVQGLLTSGSLFGAVLGTLLSFVVAEPIGRRGELILASCLIFLGTVCTCLTPQGDNLLAFVFAARGLYGLGIAFSMHAAPVYISEIAPPAVRGKLVSLKEGFIVFGILMGFSVTAFVTSVLESPPNLAWRFIWLMPAATSLVNIFGMIQMPESPRWFILRAAGQSAGGAQDCFFSAAHALRRLRSRSTTSLICDERAVRAELNSIQNTLAAEKGATGSCSETLQARRALVAGLGLVLLQQVTGQPSVLYYQEAIFRDAGFGDLAAWSSVIVGVAKLLATLFTVSRVDDYGRRPLLFAGISMMLVALLALAVAFDAKAELAAGSAGNAVLSGIMSAEKMTAVVPAAIVVSLMVYVCGYQVGFGPIAWLMISEVFPLRTRAAALSIAVSVNFGFNLLVTFTLPTIQTAFDTIDPGKGAVWLFTTYAILCAISIAFTAQYVPETKGKTLEQIEAELRS
jgi:sugar porter (SP) family MFS transporter